MLAPHLVRLVEKNTAAEAPSPSTAQSPASSLPLHCSKSGELPPPSPLQVQRAPSPFTSPSLVSSLPRRPSSEQCRSRRPRPLIHRHVLLLLLLTSTVYIGLLLWLALRPSLSSSRLVLHPSSSSRSAVRHPLLPRGRQAAALHVFIEVGALFFLKTGHSSCLPRRCAMSELVGP